MNTTTIKETFNLYLEELTKEKEMLKNQLSKEDRLDEATHISIELNIIDIFTKMFEISCNQTVNLELSDLRKTYLNFFDKIPANWYTNLEKCKTFGKDEEAFIEELKIKQAESIKSKFLEYVD